MASAADLVDELRQVQRSAWQRGERPLVESFVSRHPELSSAGELLLDLIVGEYWLRRELGEQPSPMEYVSRFPEWERELSARLGDTDQAARRSGSTVRSPSTPVVSEIELSTLDEKTLKSTPAASGSVLARPSGFTILKPHARGGLGQVSVARDERLRRQVALKQIRPDCAHDPQLRELFINEAEITGQLEHPGIVPIYALDADSTGTPYYAMRFIQGRTLGDAIRDYRAQPTPLRLRELLKAFVTICQTMAYAHHQRVIHRDLKPANVMLGDYGETLVVDWGLARRLQEPAEESTAARTTTESSAEQAPLTAVGQVLGTPAFMAPEQARDASQIGPAADIYSLGAILYQLLTGKPPFADAADVQSLLARLREGHSPLAPRQLAGHIPRGLEAVCLKAMSREPADRYETAAALALDVDRYLADEPVLARRENIVERASRWYRRHPSLVATLTASLLVGVISLLLVTAVIGNTNQQLTLSNQAERIATEEANRKRRDAELAKAAETKARSRAEGATEYLVKSFRSPDPEIHGRKVLMADVLDRTAQDVQQQFADDNETKATLLEAIGRSYLGLGLFVEAIPLFDEAQQLRSQELGPEHKLTLESQNNLAGAYWGAKDYDRALPLLEDVINKRQAVLRPDHPDTLLSQGNLASLYQSQGKFDLAMPLLESVVSQMRKLPQEPPDLLKLEGNLASLYKDAGRLELAMTLQEKNLARSLARYGEKSVEVIRAEVNLAATYNLQGQPGQALPLLERAVKQARDVLGIEHPNAHSTMMTLADAQLALGQFAPAIALLQEVLAARRVKPGPDHPETWNVMNGLAQAYKQAGQLESARALHEETWKLRKEKLGDEHRDTLASRCNLADTHRLMGQASKALGLYVEATPLVEQELGPDHVQTLQALSGMADAYLDTGSLGATLALPILTKILERRKTKLGADHPDTLYTLNRLAYAYRGLGKFEQAIPLYQDTLATARRTLRPDHPTIALVANDLAEAYRLTGQPELALPLNQEALERMRAAFGPDHSNTLFVLNNQALTRLALKQPQEAVPLLEEVLKHFAIIYGENDPRTTSAKSALSMACLQAGDFDKALPLLDGILERIRKQGPAQEIQLAGTLFGMSEQLLVQRQFAVAEKYLTESVAIYERRAPRSVFLYQAQARLGIALTRQQKFAEAETQFLASYQGLKSQEKQLPPQGKTLLELGVGHLVELYMLWDKPEEAARWKKELPAGSQVGESDKE